MADAKARTTARSARTAAAVSATPTSRKAGKPVKAGEERPSGQPLWLQIVTFVLAILGLVISVYETWAEEFNSAQLAGCPTKPGGVFDCGAVLTSAQSHLFGIPVAVLGIVGYAIAVPMFSPWGWRLPWRQVHLLRLAGMVVGMGFVVYLIYSELQIGSSCEYCTYVHIVTFLLFCITVFSAAIWGFSAQRDSTSLA
jgi:uncharacterized membrane protein